MTKRKHILIVEDNLMLADAIAATLKYEKIYEIYQTSTIGGAQEIINTENIDLIVLDRMLNNVDSIELLQWLESQNITVKVIFLSVKNTPKDKILGLRAGAHDYLGKPFDIEELCLRVENLLTTNDKNAPTTNNYFHFGQNRIDIQAKQAYNFRDELRLLSDKECKFLEYLLTHPNTLITRADLFEHVWGYTYNKKTRVIDNLIMKLRKFFETEPQNPTYFLSKRNGGYIFSV